MLRAPALEREGVCYSRMPSLVLAGGSCLLYRHGLGREVPAGKPVLLARGGRGLLAFPDQMVQGAGVAAKVAGAVILAGLDMVEEG